MILALPEDFFKDWKLEIGDLVIAIGPNKVMKFYSDDGKELGGHWKTVVYLDSGSTVAICNELRPIPNQKQLQEMLNLSPIKFIEGIFKFASSKIPKDADLSIYSIDMECFTLAYVMEMKFGKYWNGENWVENHT